MLQSDIQQQQIPPKEGLQSKTEWQVVTNRIHAQENEAAGGDRQEFCREENNITKVEVGEESYKTWKTAWNT